VAAARLGLTARGIIYLLIGWVAVMLALGKTTREADQRGALQMLAGQPFGMVALWLLGIGFAAYALWRLSEAAFGVTGDGRDAGPRLRSLVRALIYAGFAVMTFLIINGTGHSQSGQQQDWTARLMHQPGGRWAVAAIGVAIVIAGLVLVAEGARLKFEKYLRLGDMSARTRRVVEWLGMAGTAARGLIFAIAGVLVVDAAVTFHPAKAGGLDKALRTLRDQPFGQVGLIAAAAGLIVFGIYGLCEARWHRV